MDGVEVNLWPRVGARGREENMTGRDYHESAWSNHVTISPIERLK